MRRLSGLLEAHGILPAAVTEGVMIFILVIFLEPVKRLINRALHKAFVSEFERVQKLSAEIQDFAKQTGDLDGLKRFVEDRTREQLGLGQVILRPGEKAVELQAAPLHGKVREFPIRRGSEVIGILEVTPAGAELSGDQFGALELLADQLAAALELCQLIADKLKLERELLEKARMAFLGEMAARIAHNVKNPLSSMKTLVQLLEEDASLPERVRQDCRLVVDEVDRLNHNISQLLRYAKPARDTDRPVDLAAVVKRVLVLTRAESERRQVKLEMESSDACPVEGGEEAANDIVSNLVVNALEASEPGNTVRISLKRDDGCVEMVVEDQGRGIPPELREKIFQPFFTTRPGGTGLGLAIVARRLEEIGGSVECVSPLDGQEESPGTRFLVRFRAA
jgi:signal transduction histidine kinase